MNREQLKGYLLAYCDSIDELVKRGCLTSDDLAVKAVVYLREYLQEIGVCRWCGEKLVYGQLHLCNREPLAYYIDFADSNSTVKL